LRSATFIVARFFSSPQNLFKRLIHNILPQLQDSCLDFVMVIEGPICPERNNQTTNCDIMKTKIILLAALIAAATVSASATQIDFG